MKIQWTHEPMDPGTWDLCGTHQGRYVDVVQDVHGTWSIYYANRVLERGVKTRETAREMLNTITLTDVILGIQA